MSGDEGVYGPTRGGPSQELRVSRCDLNVAAKPQCSFVCNYAWQEGRGSLFLGGGRLSEDPSDDLLVYMGTCQWI